MAAVDKPKDQGSFEIDLKDATEGNVVTRFPPEPSGYLHIGHAKAALLNDYFSKAYKGKLIIRFDDTNPSKEKSEFEESIKEDLLLLGIKGDVITHTSDHFDKLYQLAIDTIKKGLAYVDDTDQNTMRDERMKGIASKNRDLSIEENLKRFQEMTEGTEFGLTACLRAKMSVDNKNKAMRDPVIYRCNLTPHHRTGSKYKVYPTYDFACPAVDSIEGVTHALRTNEYRDRNPQYEWFLEKLELRKVHIWDFSRINFVYTLLSKRKLQWFVDQNLVTGWDDPRFPTVRGIRRRGMTIDALKQYILMQGASQSTLMLEWDKLWALNKKTIDPVAPRHVALTKENICQVKITGHEGPDSKEIPLHKKNLDLGNKTTYYSSNIYLEQEDVKDLVNGEEITLMDWGNAIVEEVVKNESGIVTSATLKLHLEGDFKKTKKKLTWLANVEKLVNCTLLDYDYLITKKKLEENDEVANFVTPISEFKTNTFADPNVESLKKGDIIQFERKGYYIVDKEYTDSEPHLNLIYIPDGKAKSMASKADKEPIKTDNKEAAGSKKAAKKAADKEKRKDKKKASKEKEAGGYFYEDGIAKSLKHLNLKCMYQVKSLYKNMQTPDPKDCCKMYVSKSYY
ncbi:glutamyl-tRNA synthetase [Neoconidiobolus thromboides FSU 785]|nr:glutamyl-tRNA synthetase [Neoconidiobolus thromboides FSU 785]